MSRATERWEHGPAHPHQADDVDVEDALPLGVVVGFDATLGGDAGVVDKNVESPEAMFGLTERGCYGSVVGDVCLNADQVDGQSVRSEVQARDACAAISQPGGDGQADPGRSTSDDGAEPGEVVHESCHCVPPGYWYCAMLSARISAEK